MCFLGQVVARVFWVDARVDSLKAVTKVLKLVARIDRVRSLLADGLGLSRCC